MKKRPGSVMLLGLQFTFKKENSLRRRYDEPSHQVQPSEPTGTVSRANRVCTGRANILQRTCEHLATGVRTLCSGRCKTYSLFSPSPPPDKNLGKECLNLSNGKDTTLTLPFASF
jgi:hypothetical protein